MHAFPQLASDPSTARQLFGGPQPAPPQLQAYAATPHSAQHVQLQSALEVPLQPPPGACEQGAPLSAEQEAEEALRYLEAEWSMRMEAPLSALTALEESITRQIAAAHRRTEWHS